jgi:hypothetical protein
LLADNAPPSESAINIPVFSGFGTVSSTLVGIPQCGEPVLMHANGPPHGHAFVPAGWTA